MNKPATAGNVLWENITCNKNCRSHGNFYSFMLLTRVPSYSVTVKLEEKPTSFFFFFFKKVFPLN